MATLTKKQQLFVEEYLACWNATEAARRAGYSEKTARSIGQENLTKPDIARAIQQRLDKAAMTASEVLARLSQHARADIRSFVRTNADGALLGFDVGEEQPTHLIKGLTITETTFNGVTTRSTKLDLHDAQAALGLLGKHHRLFNAVNLNIDMSQFTDDEIDRIRRGDDPLKVLLERKRESGEL